jgi:flagellar protein FlbT
LALTVKLKPGQKIIINGAVIESSSPGVTAIRVLNPVSILREQDVIPPEDAVTPASRVYYAIQCAYLFPHQSAQHLASFNQRLLEYEIAAPSAAPLAEEMRQHVAEGNLYRALKSARQLIAHETEVLKNVQAQLAQQLQQGSGAGLAPTDGGLGAGTGGSEDEEGPG